MPTANSGDRPPFFIVGADRSGTTLLRLYLNAHSGLAVPSESWFLIELFAAFGPRATLAGETLERAVRIVTEHPRFLDGWHVSADRLRSSFVSGRPVTLAAFCERLYRLEIAASAAPGDAAAAALAPTITWGDKTPEYVEHLQALDSCFPGARFIHLMRDGRDVYLSLAKRRWRDRGYTPYELGRYWSRCVSLAAAARDVLGTRIIEVRYEDLVVDTPATLRRITDFLGVDFEPTMLRAHVDAGRVITASESAAGIHEKLSRPPRQGDVGRWRRAPLDPNLRLAAGVMAAELRRAGYRDAPPEPEAMLLRAAASYDHLWRRQTRPLIKRLVRKAAAAARTVGVARR